MKDGSLQAAPCGVKTAGASRSAVTRRFVAATQARVEAELSRSLEDLRPVVLGLRLGSTENAVLKLGLSRTLTRSLSTTNAVENVMSSIRRRMRNVEQREG